jgi:hypothetical protein
MIKHKSTVSHPSNEQMFKGRYLLLIVLVNTIKFFMSNLCLYRNVPNSKIYIGEAENY